MSKNGAVRKWSTSIGFNVLETMESVFLFGPCCIYTDRRTFRTDEKVWKEPLLTRKTLLVLIPHGCFLCRWWRVCQAWSMMKTSLCKTIFLLSSAVSKSSLGRERSRLKRSLPEEFRCFDTKRTPNRKTLTFTIAAQSQLHHFLRHVFMLL